VETRRGCHGAAGGIESMKLLGRLFRSSLGRKYVMAGTGVGLFLFVAGHMAGNLQIFLGPEAINRYAHFLQGLGDLLWVVRLGLLALLTLHIWSAVTLTLENRSARPVGYQQAQFPGASYASRTMIWSGLVIAAFVVFHLLHYTAQVPGLNGTGQDFHTFETTLRDGTVCHDVFKMMVVGFSNPVVAGFYLVAVSLLCLHLGHGVGAMFQSLGFKDDVWGPRLDRLATAAAWVLVTGYASIPVAILLGYGKEALK
jgi:succinate dehydrogenase / fumarate reductase cytochrome b subunit